MADPERAKSVTTSSSPPTATYIPSRLNATHVHPPKNVEQPPMVAPSPASTTRNLPADDASATRHRPSADRHGLSAAATTLSSAPLVRIASSGSIGSIVRRASQNEMQLSSGVRPRRATAPSPYTTTSSWAPPPGTHATATHPAVRLRGLPSGGRGNVNDDPRVPETASTEPSANPTTISGRSLTSSTSRHVAVFFVRLGNETFAVFVPSSLLVRMTWPSLTCARALPVPTSSVFDCAWIVSVASIS